MLVQIETGEDAIGAMNMSTSLENALNIMSEEEQIEKLQMLLPEKQTEVLNYSETDGLNL